MTELVSHPGIISLFSHVYILIAVFTNGKVSQPFCSVEVQAAGNSFTNPLFAIIIIQ
jgi:hypothetical protein